MREILFRGFHEDMNGKETIYIDCREIKGEWVEGFYSRVTNNFEQKNVHFITRYKDLPNGETVLTGQYIIEPETVGQYTGLTDKNGKKIFEGDICTLKKTSNSKFSVKYEGCTWYLVNEKGINCFCLSIYKADELEIIDNIFSNPELLRSEK